MSDQHILDQTVAANATAAGTSNIESNEVGDKFSVDSELTAGQLLKKVRTEAGLHIAALAVSLRVPVKRIEALESDRLELLPNLLFARALTSSICQTLKISPKPILEKLPKVSDPLLNSDEKALNTQIVEYVAKEESAAKQLFKLPLVSGLVVLTLATAAIIYWPITSSVFSSFIAMTSFTMPNESSSLVHEVQISKENSFDNKVNVIVSSDDLKSSYLADKETVSSATNAADTIINGAGSAAFTNAATSGNDVSTAMNAANIASQISLNPVTVENNLVTFKATGETWVEVKSASGATVLKKLLKSGETVGASGALPLTVTVGKADVTQVEIRGKPLDLVAIAISNVARFEVK